MVGLRYHICTYIYGAAATTNRYHKTLVHTIENLSYRERSFSCIWKSNIFTSITEKPNNSFPFNKKKKSSWEKVFFFFID